MTKLLVTAHVFGKNYEEFIPIYIYFLHQAYPQYDCRIYYDDKLTESTQKQLNLLSGFKKNFEIVENFESNIKFKLNNNLNKSLRWLIYEEDYLEYDYIYTGDIDLLIFNESPSLLDQHVLNCKKLNLPYSNSIRAQIRVVDNKSIKEIVKNVMKYGMKTSLNNIGKKEIVLNRLTGLHFVESKKYFNKIVPTQKKMLKDLQTEKELNFLSGHYHNNEALLYKLVKDSGIGLPPISGNSTIMDPEGFNMVGFRPHHGIHLGIFRDKGLIRKEHQVLQSFIYKEYYNKYSSIIKNSEFSNMEQFFGPYLKRLMTELNEYLDYLKVDK